MNRESDWYNFLADSLEPIEDPGPLANVEPLPQRRAADEGTLPKIDAKVIRRYFNENLYPYEKRLDLHVYYSQKLAVQVELVKLQNWVKRTGQRVVVVFEGRDAAGKGSTIKRFMEHLNPRGARVVALDKPTEQERLQWYFQRYVDHLPGGGEIVFFDRSWYNRAGVEKVMGFCSDEEYDEFLKQAPAFESMLVRSGLAVVKFYLSVTREEQARRFDERRDNPLKQWKLSPIDLEAQRRWDDYTDAKNAVFRLTDTPDAPWIVVKAEDKLRARLESMRFLLSQFEYDGKDSSVADEPDPLIVARAIDLRE